jgi:N-acetylmuramoyl-L-alanine amidase
MCVLAALPYFAWSAGPACASGTNRLTDIRHWSAPTYTRIVLDLHQEAEFKSFTLTNPARIVVDVLGVVPQVPRDLLVINDKIVKQVRAAGSGRDRVRIVLDLDQQAEHTIFSLGAIDAKQPRLVIDVSRPDLEEADRVRRTQTRTLVQSGTRIVVVDPGHGGEDPGAVGRGRLYEKDIVLAMSRRLVNNLNRQPGIKAYLTRTGDYFIPLAKRVEIARQYGADMFISIHADASFNTRAAGSSVYCLSFKGATSNTARMAAKKENASDFIGGIPLGRPGGDLHNIIFDLMQTHSVNAGLQLGGLVLKEIAVVNRLHTQQLQQANFAVLRAPHIPSVLIETDFISNPGRARRLRDKNFQESFSRQITGAVMKFFKEYAPQEWPVGRPAYHVVKRGDTLSGLAVRYNTSVAELRQLNAMSAASVLRIGSRLKLPAAAGPSAPVDTPAYHEVERGDTLSGLAARYNTSVAELRQLNAMRATSVLRIGSRLKLPAAAGPSAPVDTPAYHVVERGDTLSGLAARYKMSVASLCRLNGIKTSSVLHVGMKLKLL